MNPTTAASWGAYRPACWLHWLIHPHRTRAPREQPPPPPLLRFGLMVDGQRVHGTRWGLGSIPMVYVLPGQNQRSAPAGDLVRTLLRAGYGVVALDAPSDAVGLALSTVQARHGRAAAVLTPSDPDASSTIAGLLAGRRVRF